MYVKSIVCWACDAEYSPDTLLNLCTCGKPLRVNYDLEAVSRAFSKSSLSGRDHTLWRYREVLPLPLDVEPPTLGEGGTPLIPADKLAQGLGMDCGTLFIKDEG